MCALESSDTGEKGKTRKRYEAKCLKLYVTKSCCWQLVEALTGTVYLWAEIRKGENWRRKGKTKTNTRFQQKNKCFFTAADCTLIHDIEVLYSVSITITHHLDLDLDLEFPSGELAGCVAGAVGGYNNDISFVKSSNLINACSCKRKYRVVCSVTQCIA